MKLTLRLVLSTLLGILLLALALLQAFTALPPWTHYLFLALLGVWVLLYPLLLWHEYRFLARMDLGLSLLREQDYASQLARTGNKRLDRVVELFNRLFQILKEERLRFNEQAILLGELIEVSPMGIIIFDYNGHIARLNPAARTQLGIPRGEPLVGKKLVEMTPRAAFPIHELEIGEKLEVRDPRANLYRISCESFFDRGFPRRYWIIETLTDSMRAHERATYTKLIRMCAHEVNNTAGSLNSLLDTCVSYLGETPDGALYAEALATGEQRLQELVSFIARIAELAKLPPPEKSPLALDEFLREMVARHRLQFHEQGVNLRYNPIAASITIAADRFQLGRVLENILKNARESIEQPSGGEIVISVEEHARGIELVIADNGTPIAPERQAQLFIPFFTTKVGGQGLGLLLCREILEAHGFSFSLQTEPDGWTRFRIGVE